jgi:hypothetical protein
MGKTLGTPWGVPVEREIVRVDERSRSDADQVVLMDAVRYLVSPHRGAADLFAAAVAFDDEQITGLEATTLQFTIEELDLVHAAEIESPAEDIRDAQEWIGIRDRAALRLLLNTTAHFGHVPDRTVERKRVELRKGPLPEGGQTLEGHF